MISRVIILLLLLVSCTPQKKLTRLMNNHPELFSSDTSYIITNDTITVYVPERVLDTIVLNNDTIIIDNTEVRVEVIRDEVFTNVRALCKSDTIYVPDIDTISIVKTDTIIKEVNNNKPHLIIGLVLVFILFLVSRLVRLFV